MLREVFRSVPLPYMKQGDPGSSGQWYPGGYVYPGNKPPYLDKLQSLNGMMVGAYPTMWGPNSIYVWGNVDTNYWPSWGTGYWRFDGKGGRFIKRIIGVSNLGTVILRPTSGSRAGRPWAVSYYDNCLIKMTLGASATAIPGEEPDPDQSFTWEGSSFDGGGGANNIPITHFKQADGVTPVVGGFGHAWVLDDIQDRFIWAHGAGSNTLSVYTLSTGKLAYSYTMQGTVGAVCFEDDDHVYVLLGNRTLVLFDYIRGEVLGASKVPRTQGGGSQSYWNNTNIRLAWDTIFRRVLLIEKTPDNPDGSSTTYIRGFRLVPEPVRITTPIPLKVPRQGRVIPVLIQTMGDMNEGVGGYVLHGPDGPDTPVLVTGSGSLAGVPISDHHGSTIFLVACEGSLFFGQAHPSLEESPAGGSPEDGSPGDGSPGDPSGSGDYWAMTGSPDAIPPHTGLVEIWASASLYTPDPLDVPITGVPGSTGGGSPGPPGPGGTDDPDNPGTILPKTAPNMKYMLDNIYNSKPWNFAEWNQQAPNGRGQFTHDAVQALHDVDARFGHIDKHRQTWYHPTGGRGHAVDALCFKCDDGVTAEIYDIAGGEADSKPTWGFWKRSAENLDKWFYPCPL